MKDLLIFSRPFVNVMVALCNGRIAQIVQNKALAKNENPKLFHNCLKIQMKLIFPQKKVCETQDKNNNQKPF